MHGVAITLDHALIALDQLIALGADHDLPAMPRRTEWHANVVQWHDNIGTAIADDVGPDVLSAARDRVRADEGFEEGGIEKNPMFIGLVVERLHEEAHPPSVLGGVVDAILKFAESVRHTETPEEPTDERAVGGERVDT